VNYTLNAIACTNTQAVAIGVIEAGAESLPLNLSLKQVKRYAACKRLNVPLRFSSNGHPLVQRHRFSGLIPTRRGIAESTAPDDFHAGQEQHIGFRLGAPPTLYKDGVSVEAVERTRETSKARV
jgi:hypothetical protein